MPKKQIRKEQLKFEIRKTIRRCWDFYKKYHYLNETLSTSGHFYEMTINNKKVGFCSIAKFPHPINKKIMKINRLCIIPEFQGFGLGIKFINAISELYPNNDISLVTGLKGFIVALNKSDKWKCVRFGRCAKSGRRSTLRSSSNNRITATFKYQKNGKEKTS